MDKIFPGNSEELYQDYDYSMMEPPDGPLIDSCAIEMTRMIGKDLGQET